MDDLSIGCLTPDCGRIRKTRGVCVNCYRRYAKLVTAGETTWQKLEQEGKISPKSRGWVSKSILKIEEVQRGE